MQQRSATPKLAAIVGVLALLLALTMTPAGAADHTSPMFDFVNGKEVPGSGSSLTRDGDTITLEVETTTRPGAYTIWWIIFNNPAMCSDPGCGEDDLFNEDGSLNIEQIQKTQLSALWATGEVVGNDRVGEFSATLEEGAENVPGQLLLGSNVGSVDGLADAAGAEVHPILRWHGPASKDPDMLEKQLTTVEGGCRGQKLLRSGNPSGNPGEGPCKDLQFAVHK